MEPSQEHKKAILEAQVKASFQGHDIGAFEAVENGYQALSRLRWYNLAE